MEIMGVDHDRPAEPLSGLAARRERLWGILGGGIGAAFGVGSALIAVLVEGAPWISSGAYPRFFAQHRLLAYDFFLLGTLAVGLGFVIAGLVLVRFGRYPRTDGYGAGLLGAVLTACSGAILFARLFAVIRGG